MRKPVLTSASAAVVSLFLLTACAEEGAEMDIASPGATATESAPAEPATESSPAESVAETDAQISDSQVSIMDQPVDFSSPENVEKTLEAIRQQAGEKEASSVNNAIGYLMVYDLSVNRDKNKLYEKLNGKTAKEILALARR